TLLNLDSSKESARIIETFRANPDALPEEEHIHGFHLFAAEIRHVENLFLQNVNKMISKKNRKF
ncbi:MAG: hypothetical protein ACKVIG_08965, partial [Flavobacteriales bacterium]